jgi:hypothetical protein
MGLGLERGDAAGYDVCPRHGRVEEGGQVPARHRDAICRLELPHAFAGRAFPPFRVRVRGRGRGRLRVRVRVRVRVGVRVRVRVMARARARARAWARAWEAVRAFPPLVPREEDFLREENEDRVERVGAAEITR